MPLFPRYLADDAPVLWLTKAEAGILMMIVPMLMILEPTKNPIYDFFLSVVLPVGGSWWFAQKRDSKPRGYLKHIAYDARLIDLEGYPPSTIKTFSE